MEHILLVDDHRTFLAGTAVILEKHGYQVTTASSGVDALNRIEERIFDLYMFDLKLPGMNGFELTEATLRHHPEAAIVILTGEEISEHYDRLMELGVTGILEKSLGEQEFVSSLQLAKCQLMVLPITLSRQLRTKESHNANHTAKIEGPNRTLTEKEVDVLKLIAQGCKNKDIADRLFMSQRNVEYVISHLFEKLGVSSRHDAVMKGIESKWLSLR